MEKIKAGEKLHTIRGNLALWQTRIAEVQAGEAVLSLRYWDGKRRKKGSKQVEFARLTAESGVGVQELRLSEWKHGIVVENMKLSTATLATNDGLEWGDFDAWFINGKYDLSKPMAIIYFTKFRY